jgi:hypothetical protein
MKEQIKELRVKIDALSQLVKELKPFSNEVRFDLPDDKVNYKLQSPSGLTRVTEVGSTGPAHKYQGVVRTDYGTFRYGSNYQIDLLEYGLDLNSKEINKAYDSLILAKAWLGKVFEELVGKYPVIKLEKEYTFETAYNANQVSTYNVLGKDLNEKEKQLVCGLWLRDNELGDDKVNDRFTTDYEIWNNFVNKSHTEKVECLREEIEQVVLKVKDLVNINSSFKTSREFAIARTNAYNHLCEARFWLGFELQRIKEQR